MHIAIENDWYCSGRFLCGVSRLVWESGIYEESEFVTLEMLTTIVRPPGIHSLH